MIYNFEKYNESIRDQMTPKSYDDVNDSVDIFIKKIQKIIDEGDYKEDNFDAKEIFSTIKIAYDLAYNYELVALLNRKKNTDEILKQCVDIIKNNDDDEEI